MKRIALLALLTATCGKGVDPSALPTNQCVVNVSGAGSIAACGNVAVVTSPSPSPTVSPVQDCRVDYLTGSGPDFIPLNGEGKFDLTPMQTFLDAAGAQQTREVSAACNDPKAASTVWQVGEARALQITPAGFKATVKRIGTGTTTVQVSFEGRAKVWQVQ